LNASKTQVKPTGDAEFRIARRQTEQDAGIEAHAADRVARAETQQAAILGAGRDDVGEVGAADELADDSRARADRARDRQAVDQQIVLRRRSWACRSSSGRCCRRRERIEPSCRSSGRREILHVLAQAGLVAGVRQARRKPAANRRAGAVSTGA
jgi:hypothetical protein